MHLLETLPLHLLSQVSNEVLATTALTLAPDTDASRKDPIIKEVLSRNDPLAANCLLMALRPAGLDWFCSAVLEFVADGEATRGIVGLRNVLDIQTSQQLLTQALGPCTPTPWVGFNRQFSQVSGSWADLWKRLTDFTKSLCSADIAALSAFDYLVNYSLFADGPEDVKSPLWINARRVQAIADLKKRKLGGSVHGRRATTWLRNSGRLELETYLLNRDELRQLESLTDAQWLMFIQQLSQLSSLWEIAPLLDAVASV